MKAQSSICCSDSQSRSEQLPSAHRPAQDCDEQQVCPRQLLQTTRAATARTRKLLELSSMLSWVPMRVNTLSTSLIVAYRAGTKEPICAITTMRATCKQDAQHVCSTPCWCEMSECTRAWPDAGKWQGPKVGCSKLGGTVLSASCVVFPEETEAHLAGEKEPVWSMSTMSAACTQ